MLTNATYTPKKDIEIPSGSQILETTKSIEVKEIENGYITVIRSEIKYELGGQIDYCYHKKLIYSKTNPMKFDEKVVMLSDNFD